MKNSWNDNNDGTISIQADSNNKYGLNILISEHRFNTIDKITRGSWKIIRKDKTFHAITEVKGKIIKMHNLITAIDKENTELIFAEEDGFLKDNPKALCPNSFFEKQTGYVLHRFIPDGLCNIDLNLLNVDRSKNLQRCENKFLEDEQINILFNQHYNNSSYDLLYPKDIEIHRKTLFQIINSEYNSEYNLKLFKLEIESYLNNKMARRKIHDLKVQRDLLIALKKNKLSGKDLLESGNITLEDLYSEFEELKGKHLSTLFFPGKYVLIHLNKTEVRANKSKICHMSGARINKGSYYIYYNPLIEVLDTATTYRLHKPIITELAYEHYLPCCIQELEEFEQKLLNGYEHDQIFYNFVTNYKNDSLSMKRLTKK